MSIYFENAMERGFGTFPLKGAELSEAVSTAYDVGYRAFDTAQMYQNEADLGAAFKRINADRSKLFITSKVHPDRFHEKEFIPSVEKSLRDLGLEQLDMLILHWPPIGGIIDTPLKLLAKAKKQGLTKHIGVSNFTAHMMRTAQTLIDAPIMCNQVEFHPLLDQSILLAAAKETGIPLISYCSIARGEIFKYPLLAEIGQSHGKTAAQVALRWILQKGVALNTMSTKRPNIEANFNIIDFELNPDDLAALDQLSKVNYRVVTAQLVPWAPKWD